ncbi:MAG: ABC transporter ATP-binding protein [Burkholderiales bacterium]|nr:ABC transporter ATP-binding protein [Burkholderiales bacterium]
MRKVPVEFAGVSLSYGRTQVLTGVSIAIEPGEFFALLGPSGSGKSTLLRLLAGFLDPGAGKIRVGGEDVTRVPPWHRDIGMVFQNYALWPHMTVRGNVAFGLVERRLPRAEIERRVAAALELVGLGEFGERRPGQLSGGQQQRVALARTIAIEPKVLLLDEPLSNLDAKLRIHMRSELLALQRKLGITTIFVTHDQEEALSIADRVAVLDQGVIQQVGTPVELYDAPANRFIATFVGTINLFPGTIVGAGEGPAFRSEVLGEIPLKADAAGTGGAEIAVRPHALKLAAAGASPAPGVIWLPGAVTEREFLGEFVRYRVSVRGVSLIVDQAHYAGDAGYAPGTEVAVGIDPAQVKLLPGSPAPRRARSPS